MFKDYDKYLLQSLKVYLFVLVCIFIMKLVGVNYFELDINNSILLNINDFLSKFKIDYIYQTICLYLGFYFIKSIILNNYKIDFETFLIPTINILIIYILTKFDLMCFYQILNILLLLIYFVIKKAKIKMIIKVFLINIAIQFISSIIRNYDIQNYNILVNAIMNIDYYIMLIIWYKIEKIGGVKICQEVGSYLQKKKNLSKLQRKLHINYLNFKKLNKEDKISYIIYLILSIIWNVLSVIIVLLIAQINKKFIECIFILTSFWLSKGAFGKAFHLKSMSKCFIVSNLTYYVLNRITAPLGISILIPIMLGVGLSYVTSKLVKKIYKPLYKGMPKELFDETILKVTDKYSIKYNICYDYFINDKSAIYLSGKYHYTPAGIMKIKDRINKKIKELN